MPFELPPLPFAEDALEPIVSARTVEIHHGKHERGYVERTNELVEGKPDAGLSLEEIVRSAQGELFEQAAQAWNHAFYWKSLRKGGGGRPEGELRRRLEGSFGSFGEFQRRLAEAAVGQFGSGWAWLVTEPRGRLRVLATSNAETPLRDALVPLLGIDVWEHAYYLDHQNQRDRYVRGVIDHLLAWDFAAENLERAGG
jgi:Fe-Mn family superoxide dismutase